MLQAEGPRVAFRDNDSLAALLSIELKADLLLLLTDVQGLFTGAPSDPKSDFIPTYCPELHDPLIKFGDPSSQGRGGMTSKVCYVVQSAVLAEHTIRPCCMTSKVCYVVQCIALAMHTREPCWLSCIVPSRTICCST